MARILIVEDNEENAELAALICTGAGHETILAPDGTDALMRLLGREPFDLVLLDVLMPHIDGITVAMTLRRSADFQELPIIGVTAVSGGRDTSKLLAAGMNVVITKPYKRETLLKAIDQVLK
jgi:CheY-like chemotaxis protein